MNDDIEISASKFIKYLASIVSKLPDDMREDFFDKSSLCICEVDGGDDYRFQLLPACNCEKCTPYKNTLKMMMKKDYQSKEEVDADMKVANEFAKDICF